MARVHEVLRWANRRAVAEEVTRRGYRVSGESLNRWVRDEKEFPAVVERIVFELFGIGHSEAAPPWAERLAEDAAARVVRLLAAPDSPLVARLEDQLVRDGLLAPEVRPEESPGHPVGESIARRRSA